VTASKEGRQRQYIRNLPPQIAAFPSFAGFSTIEIKRKWLQGPEV
jgi:hypothetical protein